MLGSTGTTKFNITATGAETFQYSMTLDGTAKSNRRSAH
jgi:hypothetical protein